MRMTGFELLMIKRFVPTCSLPLNTYNLHPRVGFLASGGSLYFNSTLVPFEVSTVLVAAAKRPEGVKLGLSLFTEDRDRGWERDGGEAERRDGRADPLSLSLSLDLSRR